MASQTAPYNEDYDKNYYASAQLDPEGLRYRLEGGDLIGQVVDTLRGGALYKADGTKDYRHEHRLMNEEGVARVEMFLNGAVNKVVHLTKYKNEDRILRQVLEMARSFLFELTANMKRWGAWFEAAVPKDEVEEWARKTGVLQMDVTERDEETYSVHYQVKVRNKYLVLQVVENSLLASLQRGDQGFEAGNTIKSWHVQESVGRDNRDAAAAQKTGFLNRFNLFSRGGGENA